MSTNSRKSEEVLAELKRTAAKFNKLVEELETIGEKSKEIELLQNLKNNKIELTDFIKKCISPDYGYDGEYHVSKDSFVVNPNFIKEALLDESLKIDYIEFFNTFQEVAKNTHIRTYDVEYDQELSNKLIREEDIDKIVDGSNPWLHCLLSANTEAFFKWLYDEAEYRSTREHWPYREPSEHAEDIFGSLLSRIKHTSSLADFMSHIDLVKLEEYTKGDFRVAECLKEFIDISRGPLPQDVALNSSNEDFCRVYQQDSLCHIMTLNDSFEGFNHEAYQKAILEEGLLAYFDFSEDRDKTTSDGQNIFEYIDKRGLNTSDQRKKDLYTLIKALHTHKFCESPEEYQSLFLQCKAKLPEVMKVLEVIQDLSNGSIDSEYVKKSINSLINKNKEKTTQV